MSVTFPPFNIGHLLEPTKRMVHLFNKLRVSQVLYFDETMANRFLHVGLLHGENITKGIELAKQLEYIYAFPTHAYDQQKNKTHWDGITDWLSDLSWIHIDNDGSTAFQNYLLYFSAPASLYKNDPINFNIFLQVACDAAAEHMRNDSSFHLVLYPMDETFIDSLQQSNFSGNLCTTCC